MFLLPETKFPKFAEELFGLNLWKIGIYGNFIYNFILNGNS